LIPVEPLDSCAWLKLALMPLAFAAIITAAPPPTRFGAAIVLPENDDELCCR
jgi:hypothetical protein